MGTGSVILEDSKTALLKGQCRTGDLVLMNTDVRNANVSVSLTGDCFFTDLTCGELFSVSCTTGNFFVHLAPTMTDYAFDLHSPFDVRHPKDMELPKEGKNVIRLRTTAGKIYFRDKEEILKKIRTGDTSGEDTEEE